MSLRRVLLTLAALLALSPTAAQADLLPPVVIEGPIAPPLEENKGNGLCVASAISKDPVKDFGQLVNNAAGYNTLLNQFIEIHEPDRTETILKTAFDLTNNTEPPKSDGDFSGVVPAGICPPGGCGFAVNTTTNSFASRFRGFLNITDALAAKPIHLGFYADDGVSLTFWNKNKAIFPILVRSTVTGFPSWRTTNTVTFTTPGLYPLEINYVQLGERAVLEMSYLIDDGAGTFKDYERGTDTDPIVKLSAANFTVFSEGHFFGTLSGQLPYPDKPNICAQCDRQFVNQKGPDICDSGFFCNEAALCAPCGSALYCGSDCSACDPNASPFCINVNGNMQCVMCTNDNDCKNGFHCDEDTHLCEECKDDSNCKRGEICQDGSCEPCTTDDACAGNSCNCCPVKDGKKTQCLSDPDKNAVLDKNSAPWCVECTTDTDCKSGFCDKGIGACVDKLQDHNTPKCCGDGCVSCPEELKFCLPGPIGTACAECRSDMDCEDNNFCLSGRCVACTEDRRCGVRCTSCGEDTPYCFTDRNVDDAACVRCVSDAQCKGGKCNLETHDCEKTCAMTCGPDTPRCDGEKCVECYADTQCPCGGTCDLTNNTCSPSCKSNLDCLGHEHCKWKNETEKDCTAGPMQPVECGGTLDKLIGEQTAALESEQAPEFCGTDRAGGCTASGNDERQELPSAGLLGLLSVALLAARRGRGKS